MRLITDPRRAQQLLGGGKDRALPGRARRLLTLNTLPHPRWLNVLPNGLTALGKGGVVWIVGALGACLLRAPRSGQALAALLPSLLAAILAEQGLKRLIRRPRPLSARIRALALRQHPRSSFPSGDAVVCFAGAWVLSTTWPKGAPAFLGLASALGFTRVQVGAHRPSDVAAGVLVGLGVAEVARRAAGRLLAQRATTLDRPVIGPSYLASMTSASNPPWGRGDLDPAPRFGVRFGEYGSFAYFWRNHYLDD